jgi:hypothetical protein
MNSGKTFVRAFVIAICIAGLLTGCERKTRNYAGISNPPATETINPHK